MNVAELRGELEKLPGHVRVVVDGQEGGYEDPVLDADRVTDRELGPGDLYLGRLRGCVRGESGDVAVVIGRDIGQGSKPGTELAEALEAVRP